MNDLRPLSGMGRRTTVMRYGLMVAQEGLHLNYALATVSDRQRRALPITGWLTELTRTGALWKIIDVR